MIHNCKTTLVSVVRIGKLNVTNAYRSIITANKLQKAFFFIYLANVELPLDESYKLPNGSYDLSNAVRKLLKTRKFKNLSRPLIILTDSPLGEKEYENVPGWFYFFTREDDWDNKVTIISTQPLEALPKNRSYDDYLMMMFSTFIFSNYAELPFHEDTRGCFLDYCDELSDAEKSLQNGKLCLDCEQKLQKGLLTNIVRIEEIAAAKRLMNKAVGKKACFVAMPINPFFDDVYKIIKESFFEIGWNVIRADEISFPRLITNKIFLEIMSSDLVIADLTGDNPNVYFEVGMVQIIGNDLLMITQNDKIPIDIKSEQTIFYNKDELGKLKINLKKHVNQI